MRWVIAGGGTGGHLFPALAIADAFREADDSSQVLFIGTKRGIESRVLRDGRYALRTISVRPFFGGSIMARLKALVVFPESLREAVLIMREFDPHLVLGVGGYASGPAIVAAFLLRIKRAIHEQNILPGMTNRLLRWISQKIFVSFEETTRYFPEKKTCVTGTPVRKEFIEFFKKRKAETLKRNNSRFNLLVFGGSAGARRINRAMIASLDGLEKIKGSLSVIHQTGNEDFEAVSAAYREKGFEARVQPFFEEMVPLYESADLVICRAGASTIAELALCGKPAILVPYPYAARQHQLINAKKVKEAGGARVILDEHLDGITLSREVLHFFEHRDELLKMGESILRLARPNAAREIVGQCYAIVSGG